MTNACEWCARPLAESKSDDGEGAARRADSRTHYCSTRCRQAAHRFGRECIPPARAAHPIRIAYFDPPYPGLSRKYYKAHPDFAGEVDHGALLEQAQTFDAWALSTSAKALPKVLALCAARKIVPNVGAWFRGARPGQALHPRSSWEPVLYSGGRAELLRGESIDAFALGSSPRLTDTRRVTGAKPAAFLFWLFALLGARPGDTLHDAFPGSGGVGRAWELWTRRRSPTAPPAADPSRVRAALEPPPAPRFVEQLALGGVGAERPRRPSARARRRAA